jgi:voltage-gated potassium channel
MLGSKFNKFIKDIIDRTLFLQLASALGFLWLVFSAALFLAERGAANSPIQSLGDAMYWGIAALSTAGIADSPISGLSKLIGGTWIIIGSVMFFGIIVSTVTAYFMRPVQRPTDRLVESIESSLEELDKLSLEELDLLKENVDNLIEHMEEIQSRRQ